MGTGLFRRGAERGLFAALAAGFVFLSGPASAQTAFETAAPYAYMVDPDSNTVLLEKNADDLIAPASMAKLMTAEIVFHMLREGRLSLDDEFTVSEDAWRRGGATSGGSTMFLQLNSSVRLEDLLRGVIVQSGNDACIVIAEGVAGTEDAFADLMNRRAREIGLTNSNFQNSTGLPHPDQRVTARDLARLAEHIIETYPDFYEYYSEPSFAWNGITQQNRNPLLRENIGADGLKTGFTEESGYGLAASAVQNDQRLILVVNGLNSQRQRAEETRRVMQWGFRAFERTVLFDAGETVGEARVYGGEASRVPLVGRGAVAALVPRGAERDFRARIVYEGPVPAPVAEGVQIGTLEVRNGESVIMRQPLYAGRDIPAGSMARRAFDGLQELVLGWF